MQELVEYVNDKLKKGVLPAHALVSRLPFSDSLTKKRAYFSDHKHFPAFFYIGQYLKPKTVLDMTLGSGFTLSCFLLGCDPERVLGFQNIKEDVYYSPRMARHNIQRAFPHKKRLTTIVTSLIHPLFTHWVGSHKWDVVLIDREMSYDDYLSFMRVAWLHLSERGLIIMDYINYDKLAGRAYSDFCETQNRDRRVIKSKYGLGIIQK